VNRLRTPASITVSVWKALILREAVSRLSTGRAAWLWLLLEPLVQVVFLLFIFTGFQMRFVGGIDTGLWLMVGMVAFLMFRRTGTQTQNAIDANRGLFTYRQVKPIDTVLARGALEGFLIIVIALVLFGATYLFGMDVAPDNPLLVVEAFLGLWMIGMGFGLITSVVGELIPEVGKISGIVMTPLYFASGTMLPIASIAHPYRDWLLLNPLVHGLDAARLGFAPYYHAVPELSMAYLYGFALASIFVGLALHNRFAERLIEQ